MAGRPESRGLTNRTRLARSRLRGAQIVLSSEMDAVTTVSRRAGRMLRDALVRLEEAVGLLEEDGQRESFRKMSAGRDPRDVLLDLIQQKKGRRSV